MKSSKNQITNYFGANSYQNYILRPEGKTINDSFPFTFFDQTEQSSQEMLWYLYHLSI